jgi:ABC-type sugar transport system permease subunit
MARPSFIGLLLIAPALAMIGGLFLYPLGFSLIAAFTEPDGGLSLMHFQKAYELYSTSSSSRHC